MGLTIQKPVKIYDEVEIPEFYLRLDIRFSLDGKTIEARGIPYASKNVFKARGQRLQSSFGIEPSEDPENDIFHVKIPYDRANDGVDILKLAHDEVIKNLTTDEVEKTLKEDDTIEETVVREKFTTEDKVTTDLALVKEEEQITK
jgi:hypothetical protein